MGFTPATTPGFSIRDRAIVAQYVAAANERLTLGPYEPLALPAAGEAGQRRQWILDVCAGIVAGPISGAWVRSADGAGTPLAAGHWDGATNIEYWMYPSEDPLWDAAGLPYRMRRVPHGGAWPADWTNPQDPQFARAHNSGWGTPENHDLGGPWTFDDLQRIARLTTHTLEGAAGWTDRESSSASGSGTTADAAWADAAAQLAAGVVAGNDAEYPHSYATLSRTAWGTYGVHLSVARGRPTLTLPADHRDREIDWYVRAAAVYDPYDEHSVSDWHANGSGLRPPSNGTPVWTCVSSGDASAAGSGPVVEAPDLVGNLDAPALPAMPPEPSPGGVTVSARGWQLNDGLAAAAVVRWAMQYI